MVDTITMHYFEVQIASQTQNTRYLLKSWSSKQHAWKHWQQSFAGSQPVRAPEREHVGSEARGQRERLCVCKGKLLSIVRASEISETRDILTGRGLGWPRFGSLTLLLLCTVEHAWKVMCFQICWLSCVSFSNYAYIFYFKRMFWFIGVWVICSDA